MENPTTSSWRSPRPRCGPSCACSWRRARPSRRCATSSRCSRRTARPSWARAGLRPRTGGQGEAVKLTITQGATGGALRLKARVLKRDATHPDDVMAAVPVVEQSASKAGVAVSIELARFYAAGKYLLELTDASGLASDA